jgi:Xaa-Pro aminopeptidase
MFGELKAESFVASTNMQEFKKRRNHLRELVAADYPKSQGRILFFAAFESSRNAFVQDSYFYYMTGLSEPALNLVIDLAGETTLYAPQYGVNRHEWMACADIFNDITMPMYGFDRFSFLGDPTKSYQMDPYFSRSDYRAMIELLEEMVKRKEYIFTIYPENNREAVAVKQIVDYLAVLVPGLKQLIVDVSSYINDMRRTKSIMEIESLHRAIEVTGTAFQSAAYMTKPKGTEAEVQAAIEYVYTENNMMSAYYPIVAGGAHATILHYNNNNQSLKAGELLLIDTGAMFQHYCADITRVFPVSGTFTKEQRALYSVVLETQEYVAAHVKPGMYLMNSQEQELSLHHIALAFLRKHGYEKYFNHGIGHFLGLDVHDVGDRAVPLRQGDVITIEPGIYIPEKNIGIRIEDNYWVMDDAEAVCLSEEIPKSVEDIENMMQQDFDIDLS